MPMRKTVLLCLFLVPILTLQSTRLSAQVVFSMPSDTIPSSQHSYSVPVTVSNFHKIVGAQFTLQWDKQVLRITSIDELGFDDLSLQNHFNLQVDSGWINFLYLDLGLTGVDLADGSTLFRANFDVVGQPGDKTILSFANTPTEREVTDTSSISTSQPVDAEYRNGFLMVEGTTNTSFTNKPDQLRIESCSPNPFRDQTQLTFSAREAGNYRLQIFNTAGQQVFQKEAFYPAGTNQYIISKTLLAGPGTYFIRVQGNTYVATQKVLLAK